MTRPGELLRRHGLSPKKSFGQHFLVDKRALGKIAAACGLAPGDTVVEIGPGLGALSRELLAAGARLVAVERDRDMARVLLAELAAEAAEGRFHLVEADALEVDFAEVAARAGQLAPAGLTVVGNLPYNVATPLIGRLLEQRQAIRQVVAMVQREVALRLAARSGERDYGALSVGVQLHAEVERILRVPPGAFLPPPRVDSEVVRLLPRRAPRFPDVDEAELLRLARAAFQQRRKTLRTSLRDQAAALGLERDQVEALLADAGLLPGQRPETVPLEGFARLAQAAARARTTARPAGEQER